jgi:hypothetical protein
LLTLKLKLRTYGIRKDELEKNLSDTLGAYFGDQSINERVLELVSLSSGLKNYHDMWSFVFSEAIEALFHKDEEVLSIMKKQVFIEDFDDALEFMQSLKEEYDTEYGSVRASAVR